MPFPDGEPWLHYADALPFPVEASLRMKLVPPAKASKDVSRRLAHARDMQAHMSEAGAEPDIALVEQINAARMLEHGITKERLPFVYGWYRLIVAAPTYDLLVQRVEAVTEHYRDIGIDLTQSTGDQFSLFCESLPGTGCAWKRTCSASRCARSRAACPPPPWSSATAKTPVARAGSARTSGRLSAGHGPSCTSTRWLRLPATVPPLSPSPGSPAAVKLHWRCCSSTSWRCAGSRLPRSTRRGDAASLVKLLQRRGRKARIMALESAQAGLLDPFGFGDDLPTKKTMATETLRLLLPRMSEERESAMIQAVAAVADQPQPSLGKVVTYLESADDAASRNLGAVLRSMSEMRLARLCFHPQGDTQVDTEGWTTVFTLGGLTLPDSTVHRDDYSYEQRLSVALLYLVSQFARRLMNGLDWRVPKAIFLDEAWAVTSTPEGAKLVPEVSRMGRSRNTALILVSQNAGDLLNEQVTNCISSVFAFRSTERVEVRNVMSLLGIEPSEEHIAALRNLGNGECIFRDLDGRAGRIAVDLVSEELLRWLDTNPTRRKPQVEEDGALVGNTTRDIREPLP